MASTFRDNNAQLESRRIYLGNLPWTVTPSEIEEALAASGFGDYEEIHINVDPESGRNPGYCFVDLLDADTANRAVSSLSLSIGNRTVKIGPCEPRKGRNGGARGTERDDGERRGRDMERWGNRTQPAESGGDDATRSAGWRGPAAAPDNSSRGTENSKRLYVGGLGDVADQDQNQQEMIALFDGFNPTTIGRRITNANARDKPGNYNFCFIDFDTAEEAAAAMNALDGTLVDGTSLRVSLAKSNPSGPRPAGRQQEGGDSGRPQPRGDASYGDSSRGDRFGGRAMASGDWRRKDG